jgi:hypothetical protein
MAKMTTWQARFELGDYPMVCARSGLPADKLVPVEAARRAAWPLFLFPFSTVAWLFAWSRVDRDRIWGRLPFAAGHVEGISATWDKREAVVSLKGVHPEFIRACRVHQQSTP